MEITAQPESTLKAIWFLGYFNHNSISLLVAQLLIYRNMYALGIQFPFDSTSQHLPTVCNARIGFVTRKTLWIRKSSCFRNDKRKTTFHILGDDRLWRGRLLPCPPYVARQSVILWRIPSTRQSRLYFTVVGSNQWEIVKKGAVGFGGKTKRIVLPEMGGGSESAQIRTRVKRASKCISRQTFSIMMRNVVTVKYALVFSSIINAVWNANAMLNTFIPKYMIGIKLWFIMYFKLSYQFS